MDNITLHPNHSIPLYQRIRIHIIRNILTFLKKLFRKINLNCKKILILYTTLCIGIIEYACMLIMNFQPRAPIMSVWIKEATDIIHDTGRQEWNTYCLIPIHAVSKITKSMDICHNSAEEHIALIHTIVPQLIRGINTLMFLKLL